MLKSHGKPVSSKISKATNVKGVHPIFLEIAESLSILDILEFIKIYNDRLCASNRINKRKGPITKVGEEGVVGVELLIYPETKTIDFYSLTSSPAGYGRKIVKSIIDATPDDWTIVVAMDWSSGFWDKMFEEFPRIVVF